MSATPVSQPQTAGRPRLVAKTTSTLNTKIKPGFRPSAPDPMQVWNKNRITPQPSTKNLTDEELKQQYGIHLTSRLQSDGDGKEAKWADIDDDDEDDWAPETIEWGDGTKTTVNPADATPVNKSASTSKPSTPAADGPKATFELKPTVPPTSIGPNATVLKLGASAERQQAQKAAQTPKGQMEKNQSASGKTAPAPPPPKSPWAKLPPVEKTSPVEINPHSEMAPPPMRQLSSSQYLPGPSLSGPSPAKEISADDFNRSWRDSAQPQLFMPNSGRYEAVPENRRRMSRNEQGFRAPAVLQRPGQADVKAPEPSPAFQTTRTSTDVMRRRASSTLSGDSAQLLRRMSLKSGEASAIANESAVESSQPVPSDKASSAQATTPAYQARSGDYISAAGQTDAELQAQRAQQRQLMREQAELARKRRQEEEARIEAERQERIRQKLASLGPDPKVLKAEQEAKAKAEAEANAATQEADSKEADKTVRDIKKAELTADIAVSSPPKPPQPTASGEPQQYGMMKVHPLDSVKKNASPANTLQPVTRPLNNVHNLPSTVESPVPEHAVSNGVQHNESPRVTPDTDLVPEPIPRANRSVQEVRTGWGRNDHRSPPVSNLWGIANNKALGNGTFDQTLAGYAPQDLSSRASSTGQGWMNGRTPTVGQSPQLSQVHQHVPETRSQALQNMTSPEPMPLAINSEVDSLQPVRPPAPIGPPQGQYHQRQAYHPQMVNGHGAVQPNAALAGWHNFHNVAQAQDRAETERYQNELSARKEEEKRTGVRSQANYGFEETFKQVQLSEQPDQRQVNSVAQINMPPSNMNLFGAVGQVPPSAISTQTNRGSRFFPQQMNAVSSQQERRVVTYPSLDVPRSPSPPPAEDYSSPHPVFEIVSHTPVIRFPPEKAVVKLPPAKPPTPPAATATPEPEPVMLSSPTSATAPVQPAMPTQPMTWAARVSMPPPKPVAPVRTHSTPIVQNPSWQERFNGLLSNSNRKVSDSNQAAQNGRRQNQPALAVSSVTREPLDVLPAQSASVSLPQHAIANLIEDIKFTSRDVEDEEDLFEDREAGSLPAIYFPNESPAITWPRALPARVVPTPPDTQSAFIFLGSQWKEDKYPKQQFAIIRVPGNDKSVKKDLPIKASNTPNGNHRSQARHASGSSFRRGAGAKSRPAAVKS